MVSYFLSCAHGNTATPRPAAGVAVHLPHELLPHQPVVGRGGAREEQPHEAPELAALEMPLHRRGAGGWPRRGSQGKVGLHSFFNPLLSNQTIDGEMVGLWQGTGMGPVNFEDNITLELWPLAHFL